MLYEVKPIFSAIAAMAGLLFCTLPPARGAGVTIITHGFNGNITDWIIPMAQKIVQYDLFPGQDFTCYEITVGNDYSVAQSRIGGVSPLLSDSGEIIIKLDWSALSIAVNNSSTDV